MPHTCLGAVTHYHHSLVDYVFSEQAFKIVEVGASGIVIYQVVWKSLQKMVLPVVVFVILSASITKLQSSEVSLFAHRMLPCLPKVRMLQSPEPEKAWPEREARLGSPRAS
jgi:hypothetical protein